ncbi:hypothetical protein VXM60_00430 [Shewanella khirikhana]|uniref:HAAS signaling domain-containing protein n=1 Tax=Shewanella khirikhana TaxID=1965282 RepID=UPI0030CD07C1
MTEHQLIHDYLNSLDKYLARLKRVDADEVLREIESHIFDALEAATSEGQQCDIEQLLQGFGSPRELAEQYVGHILNGTPPPDGFRAIRAVGRGIGQFLYYGMGFFGFIIALALLLTGLYKFVSPQDVGLWSNPGGTSVTFGAIKGGTPADQELLGWWYSPIALMLSLAISYLTWQVLKVLKRH